jgi:hypothetical protein
MKVTIAKLTKPRLSAMPSSDRRLLLLLGNVLNEVNVFTKLLYGTLTNRDEHRVLNVVEGGQAFILIRTLIGKLHEARVLIDKRVTSDPGISARYPLTGQGDIAKALRSLNKHFAKNGQLLAAIRNTVAFHSWDEDDLVEASFASLSADEPWELYLGRTRVNSFYQPSELAVAHATLSHTGTTEPDSALGELIRATLRASHLFSNLATAMMIAIIEKNAPEGIEREQVTIPAAKISELHLPFFFDDDDIEELRLRRGTTEEASDAS